MVNNNNADVVCRKGATAGSLDGWGLAVAWFDDLASVLSKAEETGLAWWSAGCLIPKTDGDAGPLGQRPLSVLPVVYRIWASARMVQLEDWFRSWVPGSVFFCWRWSRVG